MDETARGGRLRWKKPDEGSSGDKSDGDDGPERGSPAEGLAEGGAGGNTEDVGESEAGEHERDGLGSLASRDEITGDDAADAEEGSVTERGEDAGGEEEIVGGGERAGEVAED